MDRNTAIPKANLLQAIHWIVAAWKYDMKNKPISNCFTKSSVKPNELLATYDLDNDEDSELLEIEQEVSAAINELYRTEIVQGLDSDVMSISQFLNLIEEIVEDTPTNIEVSTGGGVNSDT